MGSIWRRFCFVGVVFSTCTLASPQCSDAQVAGIAWSQDGKTCADYTADPALCGAPSSSVAFSQPLTLRSWQACCACGGGVGEHVGETAKLAPCAVGQGSCDIELETYTTTVLKAGWCGGLFAGNVALRLLPVAGKEFPAHYSYEMYRADGDVMWYSLRRDMLPGGENCEHEFYVVEAPPGFWKRPLGFLIVCLLLAGVAMGASAYCVMVVRGRLILNEADAAAEDNATGANDDNTRYVDCGEEMSELNVTHGAGEVSAGAGVSEDVDTGRGGLLVVEEEQDDMLHSKSLLTS